MPGLLCVLLFCSCAEPTPQSGQKDSSTSQQAIVTNTGLNITYKPTRGQNYTDAEGRVFGLRTVPTSITNDTTVQVRVQFAFSKRYNNPGSFGKETFRVFPLPRVFGLDGVDITDSILAGLSRYVDEPVLDKTLEPGEQLVMAFGTLYPWGVDYGIYPIAVCSHDNRALYRECNQLIDPNTLDINPSTIELLLGITGGSQATPDSCIRIASGQISYPGQ